MSGARKTQRRAAPRNTSRTEVSGRVIGPSERSWSPMASRRPAMRSRGSRKITRVITSHASGRKTARMGRPTSSQRAKVIMTFARWLLVGLPILAVFLPLAWLVMTRVIFRLPRERIAGLREAIGDQLRSLGPMTRPETSVLLVFLGAALLWVFRAPLIQALRLRAGSGPGAYDRLTDAGIAIGAALALFLIPVDRRRGVFLMDWP